MPVTWCGFRLTISAVCSAMDAARRLGEMLLQQLQRDAAPEDISALASPLPDVLAVLRRAATGGQARM